jgi:hypothetical protein
MDNNVVTLNKVNEEKITTKFNVTKELLQQVLSLFTQLTDVDVKSIGSDHITNTAKTLLDITWNERTEEEKVYDSLITVGESSSSSISGSSSYTSHCFWSGIVARSYVLSRPELRTDYSYYIFNFLFELCELIRIENNNEHSHQMTVVSFAISACYATLSSGTVHVYLSSDKQSERVGLTVGNNFWEAELYVLRHMLKLGSITDIIFHLYNNEDNNWVIDNIDNIPLWRRNWHPLDGMEKQSSFVSMSRKNIVKEDYDQWRLTQPRPHITTIQLKNIINTWYRRVINKKLVKTSKQ